MTIIIHHSIKMTQRTNNKYNNYILTSCIFWTPIYVGWW